MSKTVKQSWTERSIHFRKRKEELLSTLIERGEVRQLSNGKWMCDICPHHPILDTVEVLAVHRSGKRHQNAVEEWKARKEKTENKSNISNSQNHLQKRKFSAIEEPSHSEQNTKRHEVNLIPSSVTTSYWPQHSLYYPPLPSQVIAPSPYFVSTPYESDVREWYNTLYSRGWKLDSQNRWYRDPNVEFDEDESLPTPPEHIRHLVSTEVVPPSLSSDSSPSQLPSTTTEEQINNNTQPQQPSELNSSSSQTIKSCIQTDNTNTQNSQQKQTIETTTTTTTTTNRTLSPQEKQRRKNRKAKQKALKRATQQSMSSSNETPSNNS